MSGKVKFLKILVILTGGTIGSTIENNLINTTRKTSYRIIEMYNEKYKDDINFEVVQPINILSENLVKDQWEVLGKYLLSIDLVNYDGVIITHGSDTLAYSSAFIGILMEKTSKPITITASNKVLDDKNSNGMDNFRGCVQIIKSGIKGVYTVYRDNNNRVIVYNSTRLREADLYSDEFSSWGDVFGEIYNDSLKITQNNLNLYNSGIDVNLNNILNMKNVLMIRPYPSMNYDCFNLKNVDAVVHIFYHSSTACTFGDNTSIINFILKCNDMGIKIYGCCDKVNFGIKYASSGKFFDNNIVILNNISPEEAYVRATLGLL